MYDTFIIIMDNGTTVEKLILLRLFQSSRITFGNTNVLAVHNANKIKKRTMPKKRKNMPVL